MAIKIDGVLYDVGTASVARTVRRDEKYRVTTEDGVVHREVRATYLDFVLSLGNFDQVDYDALMEAIQSTTDDMTIELPKNGTQWETYTGVFDSITDSVVNDDGTTVTWDNLALSFTGTVPLEV